MVVYKQYDQQGLNDQYNNRKRVPDFAEYKERWLRLSGKVEKEYAVVKDIAYGKLDREQLDIYPSSIPGSKTLVFIHGGYWQGGDKSESQQVAAAFHSYNITTVILTYPIAPSVTVDQMVLSCREAIQWIFQHIAEYNGDPDQIYVAGYSAGGHLATMLIAADWSHSHPRYSTDMIKGVCALSGLFNLLPIQLSEWNQALSMNDQTVMSNSPVELGPVCSCPLLLIVGGDESEEFKEQSQELYEQWKDNIPVQLSEVPGINHYSIYDSLADADSSIHRMVRDLMKI